MNKLNWIQDVSSSNVDLRVLVRHLQLQRKALYADCLVLGCVILFHIRFYTGEQIQMSSPVSLLSRCIILATESHSGQVDKAGEPYILHPLRVMCDPSLTTEIERCVAVLHDVIEDCPNVNLIGIPHVVYYRVDILSHRPEETYSEFIDRIIRQDPGDGSCIRVKLADIRDNTDPIRLKGITDPELLDILYSLRQRYQRAAQRLLDALDGIAVEKLLRLKKGGTE